MQAFSETLWSFVLPPSRGPYTSAEAPKTTLLLHLTVLLPLCLPPFLLGLVQAPEMQVKT